jgi:hypothetical protein|tara:strand:- start:196 stop:561 length:366 start_codon:yes stop_codon:yes gene_type:complete
MLKEEEMPNAYWRGVARDMPYMPWIMRQLLTIVDWMFIRRMWFIYAANALLVFVVVCMVLTLKQYMTGDITLGMPAKAGIAGIIAQPFVLFAPNLCALPVIIWYDCTKAKFARRRESVQGD